MPIKPVSASQKKEFDRLAPHPLQSWAWGEFRRKMGQKVTRWGLFSPEGKMTASFQVFFYSLPHLPLTVGYWPKGIFPSKKIISFLKEIGQKNQALFIKIEPQKEKEKLSLAQKKLLSSFFRPSRPIFTRHTMILDLTPDEETLLKSFHPKTRYNIRLAQRKGVQIIKDNSSSGFEKYWQLMEETTKRQHFYAHNRLYHQTMWQTMSRAGIAHLFRAQYKKETLAAWILFLFNRTLYYPYGASSRRHRELMASNLLMWEAIRWGKKMNCRQFDLWGTFHPHPKPSDPGYGFHRFKMGYHPRLVEFVGTYDLVLRPLLYPPYLVADYLRQQWLKGKKKLGL